MSAANVASWLLTYLVHSTILLGAAWLMARLMADRWLALQEALLRAALIGGLLTATVQVGLGIEPLGGAFVLGGVVAAEPIAAGSTTAAAHFGTAPSPSISSRVPDSWPIALLALWVTGSTLGLAILGRSILDLRRLLRTRHFRPAGHLLDRLSAAMGLRRRVRLSTSEAIVVPFATGIRKPEICCPERVGDLLEEHKRSLFAHELAHLVRRDPAWQLLYRVGEALFFLQPLNRLIRRRLEEIAEHLTDERAAACTGDRLGLARCLVVIAHWGISPPPGVPAAAFAAGPHLDRRVRHLISGAAGQTIASRWTVPLLVVALAAAVILLPAIAPTTVHADVSPDGSGKLPAKTWSSAADVPASAPVPPAAPEPVLSPAAAPDPGALRAPAVEPPLEAAPAAPAAPVPGVAPVSEVLPSPEAVPASSVLDEQPPRAEEPPTPPARDEEARERAERERDDARERRREERRERSEAEARELATAAREQSREQAERSRTLAREAAERARMTDTEREELRKRAEVRRAEAMERSREAAERARLTDVEREEIRKVVKARRAEARAQAREASRMNEEQLRDLAERARRLAEEAEAERQD
jgi:beta-lactamase regulating signal transducer with metallopeptidase domain